MSTGNSNEVAITLRLQPDKSNAEVAKQVSDQVAAASKQAHQHVAKAQTDHDAETRKALAAGARMYAERQRQERQQAADEAKIEREKQQLRDRLRREEQQAAEKAHREREAAEEKHKRKLEQIEHQHERTLKKTVHAGMGFTRSLVEAGAFGESGESVLKGVGGFRDTYEMFHKGGEFASGMSKLLGAESRLGAMLGSVGQLASKIGIPIALANMGRTLIDAEGHRGMEAFHGMGPGASFNPAMQWDWGEPAHALTERMAWSSGGYELTEAKKNRQKFGEEFRSKHGRNPTQAERDAGEERPDAPFVGRDTTQGLIISQEHAEAGERRLQVAQRERYRLESIYEAQKPYREKKEESQYAKAIAVAEMPMLRAYATFGAGGIDRNAASITATMGGTDVNRLAREMAGPNASAIELEAARRQARNRLEGQEGQVRGLAQAEVSTFHSWRSREAAAQEGASQRKAAERAVGSTEEGSQQRVDAEQRVLELIKREGELKQSAAQAERPYQEARLHTEEAILDRLRQQRDMHEQKASDIRGGFEGQTMAFGRQNAEQQHHTLGVLERFKSGGELRPGDLETLEQYVPQGTAERKKLDDTIRARGGAYAGMWKPSVDKAAGGEEAAARKNQQQIDIHHKVEIGIKSDLQGLDAKLQMLDRQMVTELNNAIIKSVEKMMKDVANQVTRTLNEQTTKNGTNATQVSSQDAARRASTGPNS